MKFCQICGNQLDDTAKFCNRCGAQQVSPQDPLPPTTQLQPTPQPIPQPAPAFNPVVTNEKPAKSKKDNSNFIILLMVILIIVCATLICLCIFVFPKLGGGKSGNSGAETAEDALIGYIDAYNNHDAEGLIPYVLPNPDKSSTWDAVGCDREDYLDCMQDIFDNTDEDYGDDWVLSVDSIKDVGLEDPDGSDWKEVCDDFEDVEIDINDFTWLRIELSYYADDEVLESFVTKMPCYACDGYWYVCDEDVFDFNY